MLTLQTLACIDRYPQTCRFSWNSAAESLTPLNWLGILLKIFGLSNATSRKCAAMQAVKKPVRLFQDLILNQMERKFEKVNESFNLLKALLSRVSTKAIGTSTKTYNS